MSHILEISGLGEKKTRKLLGKLEELGILKTVRDGKYRKFYLSPFICIRGRKVNKNISGMFQSR